jgi:hypothetical protein
MRDRLSTLMRGGMIGLLIESVVIHQTYLIHIENRIFARELPQYHSANRSEATTVP